MISTTLPILIVEDNPVNQKVARALLKKLGYESEVADDGVEALAALSTTSYAAVLMDVQMPRMGGLEAATEIRRTESGSAHIPIIAMTAAVMEGDREECLAAGMDDYISKPVLIDELAAVLARWLS